MANEEMWDKLFKRVDSFKAELKSTKINAADALVLGGYGLSICFLLEAVEHPSGARKLKDAIVKSLKQTSLSPTWIEIIDNLFTGLCDDLEKGKES